MQFKKGPPCVAFFEFEPCKLAPSARFRQLVYDYCYHTILAPLKTFSIRDVTVIKKNFFFRSEIVEKLLLLVKILQIIRQITDQYDHILFDLCAKGVSIILKRKNQKHNKIGFETNIK